MFTLPIEPYLKDLAATAKANATMVVKAEPGAGKTTLLPQALLQNFSGKILVLEPRRLAAKLAASWVAQARKEEIGDHVGYAIRGDVCVSPATQLIYQTEGLFIRGLLSNPMLQGIDVVVIDEFHERHVYTDQALALLLMLQKRSRPDLKIVLMSATLATDRLREFLGDCQVFDIPGRTFPVTIEYFGTIHDSPEQHFVGCAKKIWQDQRCPGDILVFLTGRREIANCRTLLVDAIPQVKVVCLTADMSKKEQADVFQSDQRKFILATNVAETSLTIATVTGVLDLGRAKISSHATWSGLPTLEIKKISRDSCIQRSGRAGRNSPGVCFRLFSHDDFLQREDFTVAEIKRIDLCQTLLEVMGILDSSNQGQIATALEIDWLDPPEASAVESARRILSLIDAIDEAGQLTEIGRSMCGFSIHPRLARVIVAGIDDQLPEFGCLVASLVQEGGILRPGYRAFDHGKCDLSYQADLLKNLVAGVELDSHGVRHQISGTRKSRVLQSYKLLLSQLPNRPAGGWSGISGLQWQDGDSSRILLPGFPDRVAKKRQLPAHRLKKKRDQRPLFNLTLGRGAVLAEESTVVKSEFLLALEAVESLGRDASRGTLIRIASAVGADQLECGAPELVSKTSQSRWNEKKNAVETVEIVSYGSLEITAKVKATADADCEQAVGLFTAMVKKDLNWAFPKDCGLELYHRKLKLLESANFDCGDFPKFEGELYDLFVESICADKVSLGSLRQHPLGHYIVDQLSWEQQETLNRLVPDDILLSNGVSKKVEYPADRSPLIAGYIQDFFGVLATPTLGDGRIPLAVQLWGPNRRPLQTLEDLNRYWTQGYKNTCAEMSRRYPRHHWPKDPTRAPPALLKRHLKTDV